MRKLLNALFIEFKGYKAERKRIPLDRITESTEEDRDKVVVLCKVFEEVCSQLNRGCFIAPSRIIQTYWRIEESIKDIECLAIDIKNFLHEMAKHNKNNSLSCNSSLISGALGLFISALANKADDEEIELDLMNVGLPPLMCLGCNLVEEKKLKVYGTLGSFTGVGLDGGKLRVIGGAGPFIGANMRGGEIIIETGTKDSEDLKKAPKAKIFKIYKDKGRAKIIFKREIA